MSPKCQFCVRLGRCARTISGALFLIIGFGATCADAQMSGMPMGDIPDLCTGANISSIRTGAWSDPGTWSAARVPGTDDRVNIAPGTVVTYDVVSANALDCVGVRGQLVFRTDTNTRLTVGTLMVLETGTLEVGRASQPIAPSVIAEIVIADRPLDLINDTDQYGTGLIGLGVVRMHGAAVWPTFLRLGAEALQGQTSLQLAAAPTGWKASDKLVLPGSNQPALNTAAYEAQWEERSAAGVSGTQITLTAPLAFSHRGARNGNGALAFLPHVGNLSRNVIVRSANPLGTRGHVMFNGRADVDVRYTLLKDLGRTTIANLNPVTNHIGRYSLHMHHLYGPVVPQATGYQFTLIGNAIDGGSKWGITIHDSHFGLVQGNVVYNAAGSGIMTEDGSETGNVIDGNFVVRSWGAGSDRPDSQSLGTEGTGLWFRGPSNYVRNNVVADANSYAVIYDVAQAANLPVPSTQGAIPSGETDPRRIPIREFSNNEWYGTFNGLSIWDVGVSCCADVFEVPVSTLLNTRQWHIGRKGYYGYGTNRVTFDGWVHYGDREVVANPNENAIGLFFSDYLARNTILRRADIQNLQTGIILPPKAGDVRDIYGSQPGTFMVEDSVLRNIVNVVAPTPWGLTGGGENLPPRLATLRNVQFQFVDGDIGGQTPRAIVMAYAGGGSNSNVIVSDRLVIERYNGVSGADFQVYYQEQLAGFVVPQSANGIIGSPAAGLTNQQNWNSYGIAIAGAVAPCTATRPEIQGFVCGSGAFVAPPVTIPVPPSGPPPNPAPSSTSPAGFRFGTSGTAMPAPLRGNDSAYDPVHDVFLVVGTEGPVWGVFTNHNGLPVAAPFLIRAASSPATQSPRVAFSPDITSPVGGFGGFVVTWQQADTPASASVRTRAVAYPAGPLGGEHVIAASGAAASVGAVIAYSPSSGTFLVAWQTCCDAGASVLVRNVALDGQGLGSASQVNVGIGRYPGIAWNSVSNEFGVSVAAENAGVPLLEFNRISPSGGLLGQRVFSAPGFPMTTSLSVNPVTGNYLVASVDALSESTFGTEISSAGDALASGLISSTIGRTGQLGVAYGPVSGTFLLVTEFKDADNVGVIELNRHGAPLSTAALVLAPNTTGSWTFLPRVSSHSTVPLFLVSASRDSVAIVDQVVATSSTVGGSDTTLGPALTSASIPSPPSPPSAPSPSVSTCSSPDPFTTLGGGTCVNGGWLPPGAAPPTSSGSTPAPPSTSAGSSTGSSQSTSNPSACATPDPFAAMGGGGCYNGGWLPPGMVPPSGGTTTAAPSAPPATTTPAPSSPGICTTPDPFRSLTGMVGVCINGGWIPTFTSGGND